MGFAMRCSMVSTVGCLIFQSAALAADGAVRPVAGGLGTLRDLLRHAAAFAGVGWPGDVVIFAIPPGPGSFALAGFSLMIGAALRRRMRG